MTRFHTCLLVSCFSFICAASAAAQDWKLSPQALEGLGAIRGDAAAFKVARAGGGHTVVSGYARLYLGVSESMGRENALYDATLRCNEKGFAQARPLAVSATQHEIKGTYVCAEQGGAVAKVSQTRYLGMNEAQVISALEQKAAEACGKEGYIETRFLAQFRDTLNWQRIYLCQ